MLIEECVKECIFLHTFYSIVLLKEFYPHNQIIRYHMTSLLYKFIIHFPPVKHDTRMILPKITLLNSIMSIK